MDDSNISDSDSDEKMSTTDEVQSSRNWSEDEEDSSGSESDDENTGGENENGDKFIDAGDAARGSKYGSKKMSKRKRLHQSDTETRNLLDDVGDVDDDFIDLDETKENEKIDPTLFEISDDQMQYYTKCFLHLQRKTQSTTPSLNGAVSGADDRVVEFFRKSRLDTRALSRVWALADVNEDGFLNHQEFVMAMHLIVLHVKGSHPIPSRIPSPVRPCATPPRSLYQLAPTDLQNSTASSTLSSGAENGWADGAKVPASAAKLNGPVVPNFGASCSSTDSNNAAPKQQHSLSDDHLHAYAQMAVTDFSDAPPLLVDSRPTALNALTNSTGLAMLNSLSSRGPPPKPPAREYTKDGKGHGRSASLDLNTFAAVSGHASKTGQHVAMFHSTTASTQGVVFPSTSTNFPFNDDTRSGTFASSSGAWSNSQQTSSTVFFENPTAPTGSLPAGINNRPASSNCPQLPKPLQPTDYQFYHDFAGRDDGTTSCKSRVTISKCTQTEVSDHSPSDVANGATMSTRQPQPPDVVTAPFLDAEAFAQLMEDASRIRPAERCAVLRKCNAELEAERVTLKQVVVQLQLRIDEAEAELTKMGIKTYAGRLTPPPQLSSAQHSRQPSNVEAASPRPVKPTAL